MKAYLFTLGFVSESVAYFCNAGDSYLKHRLENSPDAKHSLETCTLRFPFLELQIPNCPSSLTQAFGPAFLLQGLILDEKK